MSSRICIKPCSSSQHFSSPSPQAQPSFQLSVSLHSFSAGRTIHSFTSNYIYFNLLLKQQSYPLKMKLSIYSAVLAFAAIASGTAIERRQGLNANRPVPSGACCIAATSLKQDICNVNGQTGRCVPASVNNCKFYQTPHLSKFSSW